MSGPSQVRRIFGCVVPFTCVSGCEEHEAALLLWQCSFFVFRVKAKVWGRAETERENPLEREKENGMAVVVGPRFRILLGSRSVEESLHNSSGIVPRFRDPQAPVMFRVCLPALGSFGIPAYVAGAHR